MRQNNSSPGFYIVFEGISGSGKTEQIKLFEAKLKELYPDISIVSTYEPGGTPEADEIRKRFKEEKLEPWEEVRLSAKSREISLSQVVRPALKEGKIVCSDRSVFSSLAYQGVGRQLGWWPVWKENREIVGQTFPDVVVYFKVDSVKSRERSGTVNPDKFDQEDGYFWKRVSDGYDYIFQDFAREHPEIKIIIVDDPEGRLSIEETHKEILKNLGPEIERWGKEREGL